ncbi:STAS domain-containing protein [Amycolatopsis anabasis]|uniref:STAS domain-containing protein n=1 Tax=Amycolatopsis anabasis TaxID=1840409 RepID=UPI00131D9AC6|nr:STAS domain-containing protein [Amycolatopsis anabasis]
MEARDAATPVPARLTVEVARREHGVVLVNAAGEIDVATVRDWHVELEAALGPPRPEILVADLTEVTFLSSSGLNTLVQVNERAESLGVPFRVVGRSRPVHRPLELTGLTDTLGYYGSVAAACASVRGHRPSGV